jgi:sugar lactone lactonase YvrE
MAAGISATSAAVNVSVLTIQTNSAAAYTWSTLAGRSPAGSADGVGSSVQFAGPAGVAVDANGNVYVTDSGNNTIRMITAAGVSSTIAGFPGSAGTNDGVGSNARFFSPQGIAIDGEGNLFVADTDNNRIREMRPMGGNWLVSTIAGTGSIYAGSCDSCPPSGGYVDGDGTNAQFDLPIGIAVDGSGNIYLADSENSVIRQITPVGTNGWVVRSIATNAGFSVPYGVAVDSTGHIYVADTYNEEICKITPAGAGWAVTILAGDGTLGSNDGTGSAARFFKPADIAVGGGGYLYVTDQVNDTIRQVTAAGVVTTLAGAAQTPGSADGTGAAARFSSPFGVGLDGAGNLYVADGEQIRKVTSAGVVSTLAGLAVGPGSADGTGSDARFNYPAGVALDSAGNLYVADAGNNTVRQVSSAGVVSTLAGLAGESGAVDGAGGNARFAGPAGLALDSGGTLYVADSGNNTIRTLSSAGVVTTIAGQAGTAGSADGAGSAALFNNPTGITVGAAGIFVADEYNNTIRQIVPRFHFFPEGVFTTWTVTTIAGSARNPLGSADGANSAAQFDTPSSLVVDPSGNIYVTDWDNDEIRRITPSGTNWVVTTIAGAARVKGSADGLGADARFVGPISIAMDGAGNLYVADQYNSTVRKLTPLGATWLVTTIGGLAGSYASADGAGSAARFNQPDGVAVDNAGNVYIADSWSCTVRKGFFTAFERANETAFIAPPMNAGLTMTLLPPQANGQWRFAWEVGWRGSGQTASNLPAGNYPVEFRTMPGWLPIPESLMVALPNGATAQITNQYFPTTSSVDTNAGGTLSVSLGPNPPSGAGWRFLGDTTPFYPSGYSTNLASGTYLIEFAPVGGFATPSSLSVQVQAGLPMVLTMTYLLASPAPAGVLLPVPVPSGEISDLTDYPFGFNGQLQTEVGFGSGVAVETNVVLTAAHLVFNDQTLSYVSQAYWFFQEEAGVFEPEPLQARGWYVLSGYASQRTNDVLGGLSPDQSSPQSRNLDVAALYFASPAAGGGYGGYLPSDATPNTWLTSMAEKMLVGYPVDGSQFDVANIVHGQMYEIGPQPYPLSQATDPLADQQVYTASWMLSYPGNSGGPFYVRFDGYYYPAGVYLGTLFNGVVPYASAVRAFDSNVVSLVTMAAALGDSGTNNSGGGVITIIPTGVSSSHPAYLLMTLGPPAAVAAGAAWEFINQPAKDYLSASQSVQELSSSATVGLQFLPVAGWNLPTNQTLTLTAGVNSFAAVYTVAIAWPTPAPIASGTPLGPQQLNAVATAASGTFAYNPPAGTILPLGTNTLTVTFTPNDATDYGGPSATNVNILVLPSAPPTLQAARQSSGSFAFTWSATINQTYQIQATTNLAPANWVNLGGLVTATNSTMSTSLAVTNVQRFYRLMLPP